MAKSMKNDKKKQVIRTNKTKAAKLFKQGWDYIPKNDLNRLVDNKGYTQVKD